MLRIILIFLITTGVMYCKENPFKKQKYKPEAYTPPKVIVTNKDTTPVKLPAKKGLYAVMQTTQGDLVIELFDKEAPATVQNFVDLAQGIKEVTLPTGKKSKKPFYDGLTFHRVIPNFMAQGGCPKGDGTGDPGYKFKDEINAKALGLDKQLMKNSPEYERYLQKAVVMEMNLKNNQEAQERQAELEENWKSALELPLVDILYRSGYRYNEVLNSKNPVKGSLAMANAGPDTNGSQFFINQVDTIHLTGLHTVFGHLVTGTDVLDKIISGGNAKTIIKTVKIIDNRE